MQAEFQDLETLLDVQKIDLEVMKAKKRRVELPQRIEVMRLRKKRAEIQGKLDQVFELKKHADADLTIIEDEERALREKQERAQELIDAAGSDYRKVESHSKEMASAAKRLEAIEAKKAEADAQMKKIQDVLGQLQKAVKASEAEEARLRQAFEGEDSELVSRISVLSERRAELMASVDPALVARYEDTASKVGGVAMGELLDDTCGVCRTRIEGGRLIELRSAAPLGVCPNCKRLLVIRPQSE